MSIDTTMISSNVGELSTVPHLHWHFKCDNFEGRRREGVL